MFNVENCRKTSLFLPRANDELKVIGSKSSPPSVFETLSTECIMRNIAKHDVK